jgi:diguanylate cyclase (GGDEF)-like protein
MTAMFRPPVAEAKAIGWAEVFGFNHGRDPFWAAVRGTQLALVSRYVPFNVGCVAINVVALAVVLRGTGDPAVLACFAAAVIGLMAVWLAGWIERRERPMSATATRTEAIEVTLKVLAFGALWALFMLYILPRAAPPQQVYLSLLSLAVMGMCGFATSVLPLCSALLVTMVAAATLVGAPGGATAWPVGLCVATFAVAIIRGVMVTSFSMMARMRTEAEHAEQAAVIGMLLSEFEANGSDWLFEIDADRRLTHVSPRFALVAKRPREAMLGHDLLPLLGSTQRGAEARQATRALTEYLANARPFRDIVTPVQIAGEIRWWQLSGTPKHDTRGRFAGYRGVGSDITDIRLSHDRIAHLARFDPLTGLANRSLLRERLEEALGRATRTRTGCALLFVDLDRFKAVNDTLGHLAGDRLLREVAARLRRAMGAEAHIGRLGGDEFAVVLPESTTAQAEAASRALVATLSEPFDIDGVPVSIGASVGFAIGPDDGATVDVLLRSADLALYEVKGSGRGTACRFVPAIKDKADERRAMEADLRGALAAGQLRLAYQPVVDAADEGIVGFEALLRWHHPVLGLVPPAKFIPVAEETGMIVEIGAWVIAEACRQARDWPDHVRVAVNLSPVQFDDPRLVDRIRDALADSGLAPDRLELEITESLFLNERVTTTATLTELKAIGIRFALDDFGTGYSSLGYLHKVAFSRIKIDRSFVQQATAPSGEAVAIIRAIVALATSLGMTTTAEGTETREEFDVIRRLGCLQVQGYLTGRPMGAAEAGALVAPVRLRAVA